MASNRIRGITIEIGGDTSKLSAALKDVDSSLSKTQNSLKDVDKLLKLDPSNTELLRQKQELLGKAIEQTKERLSKLKEASEQAARSAGNYDAWKAAYAPIQEEIQKTSERLKELKDRQKEMSDAGEINTDAYQALQQEIQETSKHLKELKEQAKAVTDEFGNPIPPEQFDALQREIVETEHNLHTLESQSGDAGEAVEELGEEGEETGNKLTEAGEKAKKAFGEAIVVAAKAAAAALAAATAAVTAFAKSSIDVGMQFDKSMSQVAATMGKTVDEIQDLRDFAMEMGAKTAFSATQAADALNFMALAGYDAETSMKVLPDVLNLAAAGDMDLALASDMITDSLSALGLQAEDAATLVDQMASASSHANASVAQMGDAILTVGGTAKVLSGGMMTLSDGTKQAYSSTTELNQVLGLLADNGVKGSEGGTALRNIILALTAPTDKAAKKLKELGVSALDSSGNMRSMKDIFADLNGAMSKMSEGQKTEVLNEIFNKVDLKSVNALMGTNIERWDALAGSIENSKWAAEKMAKVQLDNLAGDVTLFKSALEGAQIVTSDLLTPSLREFVQLGTSGLTAVTDAFKQADEAKSLAEGFRDTEGAIRPVEEIAGELQERFSALSAIEPYFSFRDEAGELGEISDLAEGLYATLSQMSDAEQFNFAKALGLDNVDDLYEILDPVNDLEWKLEDLIKTADSAVSGDKNILQSLFPGYEMDEILSWFDGSQAGIAELQAAVENVDASGMTDGFSTAMEALPAVIEDGIGLIMAGIPRVVEVGGQLLGGVVTGIINNLPVLASGVLQLAESLGSALLDAAPSMAEKGGELLKFLADGIMTGLPQLTESAVALMSSFGQYLQENLPSLLSAGLEIVVQLTGSIRENAGKLIDGGIELLKNLAQGFADSIPTLIENIPTIISNIAGIINDNAPKILAAGVSILITLAKGLIQAIPVLIANIPQIIQAIYDVFTAFNWLALGKTIITGIASGIKALVTHIPDAIKGIAETAGNIVKSFGWKSLGRGIIEMLKLGIDALGGSIPAALKTIGETAFNWIKSIDWLGLGKAIISGFISGVVGMGASAINAIIDIGRSILDAIKGLFGIHSPSTVFSDIGQNLIAGLLQGIRNTWETITGFFSDKIEGIKTAFSNLKGSLETIGGNIVGGLRQGITSAWDGAKGLGSWFMGKIDSLKTNAMKRLDEHSPSKVFAEIGRNISLGLQEGIDDGSVDAVAAVAEMVSDLTETAADPAADFAWIGQTISAGFAKGIEDNADKAESAVAKLAKNVYSAVTAEAERQIKYERLSLQEQLTIWQEIQKHFAEGSDQWWSARDKVFDLQEKVVAEQAQNIKNTYNGLVKSVEYAVKRYGWSTSIQLSHYEEIRGQFARGSEEWLAADEKVFETRQTLLKEQAAAWQTFYSGVKSVNDGIAKLEEDYQKTLADRADAIAGSYKLFDEVKDPEQTSASQLTKNLRQQVESIRDFYGNLDTLSAKLADQDWGSALVEEIRAMGVSAASELKALLSMSDDQLSEYADLYGKKQTLANEIALKELRGLREQTDAQIRENLDSIKGLYEERRLSEKPCPPVW